MGSIVSLLLCGKIFPGHQGIVRRLPGLTTRVRIGIEMNTRETPSRHHALAHVALRKVCRQNPVKFFGIMASPHRDAFFQDMWHQVRLNCDKDGTPAFDILDLKVGTFRIRDFPCFIVVMPPTANIGEAHFVGIILNSEPNPETPPEEIDFAYMVLEKGLDPESKTERTVLCSWSGDVHENHGDGPNATPEDFACALEDRL